MCIGFVFKLKRNKSLAQSFNGSAKLQMVIKGSAKVFCFNPKVVLTEKSYASKIYFYQSKKKNCGKDLSNYYKTLKYHYSKRKVKS